MIKKTATSPRPAPPSVRDQDEESDEAQTPPVAPRPAPVTGTARITGRDGKLQLPPPDLTHVVLDRRGQKPAEPQIELPATLREAIAVQARVNQERPSPDQAARLKRIGRHVFALQKGSPEIHFTARDFTGKPPWENDEAVANLRKSIVTKLNK